MSTLIIPENPLMVLPALSKVLGLQQAVVLQQLFWLLSNPKNGQLHEGKRWIYNTHEQWVETYFPFLCPRGMRRIFSDLRNLGLVQTCQLGGPNRRNYYSLSDNYSSILDGMMQSHASASVACMRQPVSLPVSETSVAETSQSSEVPDSFDKLRKSGQCTKTSNTVDEPPLAPKMNHSNPQNSPAKPEPQTTPSSAAPLLSPQCNNGKPRRLPQIPRFQTPPDEWFQSFVEIYERSEDWDDLKDMAKWHKVFDAEACLMGLLECIEAKRTGKRKP